MCGICGFNWSDESKVKDMTACIRHRGPDSHDVFCDRSVSLGHLRLAIIDLSAAGHQPMFYGKAIGASSSRFNSNNIRKASCSIVFNGEIYNYQDVKAELEAKGYRFSTKSDTEVILASYLEWGEECVKRFNGMWAFVIYDMRKRKLFCSRDRLGVKPFYYYVKGKKFIFASELKAILRHKDLGINAEGNISREAVSLYFSLGFVPSPLSIFGDVYKLPAGHNLVYDLKASRVAKRYRYYRLPPLRPIYDRKRLIEEGRAILADATRLRLISDVPVGAFLSGGLDSSSVVASMAKFTDLKKLHTFSIGFEGKYDETKYINIVKDYFKTRHHHYYFTEKDFEELVPKYAEAYDEPFWDYSGFPTLKVSHMARQHVTVALSGDGGDEVFGGYSTHLAGYRMEMLNKLPAVLRRLGSMMPAKKNLNTFTSTYLLKEAFRISFKAPKYFYALALEGEGIKTKEYREWTADKLEKSLRLGAGRLSEGLRIYDLLYASLADNFLVKVDRASMANALEVRSPFLDYRFAEFAQRIPTEWKQDLRRTKILMRDIIRGLVPDEIITRNKQGFTPPLDKWILKPKHEKDLRAALGVLGKVMPELHAFYKEKVFKEEANLLYTTYKIKLFLFYIWWKRWAR